MPLSVFTNICIHKSECRQGDFILKAKIRRKFVLGASEETTQPATTPARLRPSHLGRQGFDPKLGIHDDGEDNRRHQHDVLGLKEPDVVEIGFALQCRQNDACAPNASHVDAAMGVR